MDVEDGEDISLVEIQPGGDLLLEAKDDNSVIKARYRVDSTELAKHSGYYQKLFSLDFSDGIQYRRKKAGLDVKYGLDRVSLPLSDIPKVSLPFPMGCTQTKTVLKAFKLFLKAIHEESIKNPDPESGKWLLMACSSDFDAFANAVAIADQLDATNVLQDVAEEILKVQPMCTKKPLVGNESSETYWRQSLYIAFVYKQQRAFGYISGSMILHGLDSVGAKDPDAPWNNLPNNIPEEIAIRREGIFNTIASVPNALLKPYMLIDKNKAPICKRGLSQSPACDSFQLGESIRWLCRRKFAIPSITMVFAVPDDQLDIPGASPTAILKSLREFPAYQLDEHHSRCGIKGNLIRVLDALEKLMSWPDKVGICHECHMSPQSDRFRWSQLHRPNSTPYKGDLAKDVSSMLKAQRQQNMNTKGASQPTSEEVAGRSLPTYRQVSRHTMPHLRTQGDELSPGVDAVRNGYPQNPNGELASGLDEAGSKNAGQGIDSRLSKCQRRFEHELCAKVFAPERWTEKEWLIGDAERS